MSVWFGAYEAVQEVLHLMVGVRLDTRLRDGTRWASMEQMSRSALGVAETLRGLPRTEDYVIQLNEIGERHASQNSLTNEELDADIAKLTPMREELFRRMQEGPG